MPAKKTSPWIAHVKQYSKANNCSYGDALKRARPSYHGKGGGFIQNAHDWVKKHKIISRGSNLLISSGLAGKHAGNIGRIGAIAHKNGYGLSHC